MPTRRISTINVAFVVYDICPPVSRLFKVGPYLRFGLLEPNKDARCPWAIPPSSTLPPFGGEEEKAAWDQLPFCDKAVYYTALYLQWALYAAGSSLAH